MKNVRNVLATPNKYIIDQKTTYRFEQEDYDRVVFITTDYAGEIIGLNYHQGMEESFQDEYKELCPFITEILNRLDTDSHTAVENINRAIRIYNQAFIFTDEH